MTAILLLAEPLDAVFIRCILIEHFESGRPFNRSKCVMAKKTGTVRTSISMPADLKNRMDKTKEPINWSGLACDAFESKLAEIAAHKEKKTMTDVLERLRQSKKDLEGDRYKEGREWGKSWVTHHADAEQLQRIAREAECNQGDWEGCFNGEFESIVDPDMNLQIDDDLINDPEFVRGFVDAALEVWSQV